MLDWYLSWRTLLYIRKSWCIYTNLDVGSLILLYIHVYRILHGKCARTVFTHELWRIGNWTSERSERVRFLILNNECVNTVQSTFHVVLCLLYTYWDWTPSLNYDKLYLNKCSQTAITERKQLRKKRESSNKIQNLHCMKSVKFALAH